MSDELRKAVVTADEARAAADRLRNTCPSNLFYWYSGDPDRDSRCLAHAYLAEHPADSDEPLDCDWLESVLPLVPGRGFILNENLSVFNSRRGFQLVAGQPADDSDESFCVAMLQTRGNLRLLARSLSIPLTVRT